MKIELGKITSVRFGMGGYQDAQFGIWFQLGGDGWGVGDGRGVWAGKPSDHAKWTIKDKQREMGVIMLYIETLLTEGKVSNISELKGIPVEITFDSPYGRMLSWRILKEVI